MDGFDFTKKGICGRVGRMDQLASIRRYQLEDGKGRGMRAFEVTNASGLDFTVYPDRGLDIGPARYNGLPLTWMTQNGPVAPAFYDKSGVEWLRTWGGGLVTTCGWLNVGGPCETAQGEHGLHGRADVTPAEEVNTRTFWDEDGDYVLEITGKIAHTRVFGENLVTTRTITTRLGKAELQLVDSTENCGFETMPLMQLYHMNFGWPLICEKTRLIADSHRVVPKDAEAAKGVAEWDVMPPPTQGFAEQVLYHDLPEDADGNCAIIIANPDFGANVRLSFRKAELPYLVQWRMPGRGEYVMGLEPGNCEPVGQVAFGKTDRLRRIEPGQVVETRVRVDIA